MHYSIYKPNNNIKHGAAVQFSMRKNRKNLPVLWLEAVEQSSEKPPPGSTTSAFNWEHKVVMKIEFSEIGELLAVTQGRQQKSRHLHHVYTDPEGIERTTTLDFERQTGEYNNYLLKITQAIEDSPKRSIGLFLTQGETALLQEKFLQVVRSYYNFDPRRN